jgi:hypothetical protein
MKSFTGYLTEILIEPRQIRLLLFEIRADQIREV